MIAELQVLIVEQFHIHLLLFLLRLPHIQDSDRKHSIQDGDTQERQTEKIDKLNRLTVAL